MKVFHTDHTVDGSEIPRPTTGWMLRKPCKSWDKTDKTPTSTGVSITFLQVIFIKYPKWLAPEFRHRFGVDVD